MATDSLKDSCQIKQKLARSYPLTIYYGTCAGTVYSPVGDTEYWVALKLRKARA